MDLNKVIKDIEAVMDYLDNGSDLESSLIEAKKALESQRDGKVHLSIRTDNEGSISVNVFSKRENAIYDLVKTVCSKEDLEEGGFSDKDCHTEEALEFALEVASEEPDGFDYYIVDEKIDSYLAIRKEEGEAA